MAYLGYKEKWDEDIDKDSDRIVAIGTNSRAYGGGRIHKNKIIQERTINRKEGESDDGKKEHDIFKTQEQELENGVLERGMQIKQVASDGNCLFRAISHQVYGTEEHHQYIRQRCMDYIEIKKEYFKNYIIGSSQLIDQYIERKRQDGVGGDDIEIQALSELYNAAIEVYSYNSYPMKSFREETLENGLVLRLSYHRRSHFNSILLISLDNQIGLNRVISDSVGTIEDLTFSNLELANQGSLQSKDINGKEEKVNLRVALNDSIDSVSLAKQNSDIVPKSSQEYQDKGALDLTMTMQQSLISIQNKEDNNDEEEKTFIQSFKQESENHQDEDQLLKIILQDSLNRVQTSLSTLIQSYDEMLTEQLLDNSIINQPSNPIIELALTMGLSEDIAQSVLAHTNNDESAAIEYLYNLFQ